MKHDSYPIIHFEKQSDFEKWLARAHAKEQGIWIKFAKKGSGIPSTNYIEALDVALCYGWIDGQSKSIDETWYLQKFTPRGPKSIWSKINRGKVARLIKEKKMTSAGLEKINAAKKDGRWEAAYDSPSTMIVPEDFLEELRGNKKAEAFYRSLNKTNIYAIVWRLQTAKKPETRQRRMNVILEMLSKGEKFY